MAVQYDSISTEEVQSYLDFMNVPVALWIAGCEEDALSYIASDSKRYLQEEGEEGTVEYSELELWGVDGTLSSWLMSPVLTWRRIAES